MAEPMRVRLELVGAAAFEAVGETSGGRLVVDGAPALGGEGRGQRPMEVLLSALASCAAMDAVKILRQQKQPLESLRIEVEGDRPDTTPAPFTAIRLAFVASGAVDPHKLERAVQLGVEKYCSVGSSLDKALQVSWSARVEGT